MSPSIRIDSEVYQYLQKRAEPFADTPNSVLRRLLSLETRPAEDRPASGEGRVGGADVTRLPARSDRTANVKAVQRNGVTHLPAGVLLPEDRYYEPILSVLSGSGGSGATRKLTDEVGRRLAAQLTPLDKQPTKSGEIRWRNRAKWARNRMVKQGLLAASSPYGIWVITDAGREWLRAAEDAVT
ncbi:MAG TPA: winged helix-turn-helix domain-containing protein [Dehalococcoidia bacterium]|nr:winged helix-turn-helix domain-containing protein [Dehalococcoidia bacterium]